LICVDGGSGLLAALPIVLPGIPVQRCWAHKIRNILNKIRKADQPAAKRAVHKVMNAPNSPEARDAARRFADRFKHQYPNAVTCLIGTQSSPCPSERSSSQVRSNRSRCGPQSELEFLCGALGQIGEGGVFVEDNSLW
jgi:transposase-like protein